MTSPAEPPPRTRSLESAGDAGGGGDGLGPSLRLTGAPVTRAILALNIAVFGVQLLVTGGRSLMHLPEHEALAFGGCYALAVIGELRWETLITASFLHDGIIHLAFNMLVLWLAGPIVERAVGSGRMAPMYLLAAACGSATSVAVAWSERTARLMVGASAAICGVLAAALVVGWRVQGFRGSLTQAMLRWLGFVVAFGLLSAHTSGNVDNAAHVGGGLAGALVALSWRRGRAYSERATAVVTSLASALVVACVALVVIRDRVDPFAALDLQERSDFTREALADGRCRDAREGLLSVERLRARLAPVSLRGPVEATCGPVR